MCLAEYRSLTVDLIWSEVSFCHICVCQMREISQSSPTPFKASGLWDAETIETSASILWLKADLSSKVSWRWWFCLAHFPSESLWFWAVQLLVAWCSIKQPQASRPETKGCRKLAVSRRIGLDCSRAMIIVRELILHEKPEVCF